MDVVKIDTDAKMALTQEEFAKVREWARLAPETHIVDDRGLPHFQTSIPSQWLRALLSTIEHGYRDSTERAA